MARLVGAAADGDGWQIGGTGESRREEEDRRRAAELRLKEVQRQGQHELSVAAGEGNG